MAESTDPTRVRAGTTADRKVTPTQTTAVLAVGSAATGTVLWIVGCLKGGELYWPDDALMYVWVAILFGGLHKSYLWTRPIWQALGRKIYKAAGVPDSETQGEKHEP